MAILNTDVENAVDAELNYSSPITSTVVTRPVMVTIAAVTMTIAAVTMTVAIATTAVTAMAVAGATPSYKGTGKQAHRQKISGGGERTYTFREEQPA